MLFGKRKQVVKRILIVEDEPLTAFDNENILGDAGYEIVATVDDLDEALDVLDREHVHLILSDVRLKKQQTGIQLAKHAKQRGIPTLFATGHAYPGAAEIAVGCLMKPYTERQLTKAIDCVDRHLQGEKVKTPKGLELFVVVNPYLWRDPLGGFTLEYEHFEELTRFMVDGAERWCGGRVVSALEGGYAPERLGIAAVRHMMALE